METLVERNLKIRRLIQIVRAAREEIRIIEGEGVEEIKFGLFPVLKSDREKIIQISLEDIRCLRQKNLLPNVRDRGKRGKPIENKGYYYSNKEKSFIVVTKGKKILRAKNEEEARVIGAKVQALRKEGLSIEAIREQVGGIREHRNSKLTWEQVRQVRNLCSQGVKQSALANRFEVRESTISDIITGKSWKESENAE